MPTTYNLKSNEYLLDVDKFNNPVVETGDFAIALKVARLIMLDPGHDPLHPDMGVGLRKFRFMPDAVDKLQKRTDDQISTYLPEYSTVSVEYTTTVDKVLQIQISINDAVYIYDTSADDTITINSISNN